MRSNLLTPILLLAASNIFAATPAIFPIPRESDYTRAPFLVDERVVIADADRDLARIVMREFSDKFGLAVKLQTVISPGTRVIIAGPISNPLIKRAVAERKLRITAQDPGPEGYLIDVTPDRVIVAGSDDAGAFYGLQSLRQLMRRNGKQVEITGASVRDWPYKPFRGIKLYLPGRDSMPYFKRFVSDFMALNKYNRLIVELNAGMRLDRHPELNAGWLDFGRHMNATRRDRPDGPHGESTDSAHHDTADGGILEKDEVRELVRFAAANHIEVIPELPSLSHSYYLLTRHRELAEIPDAEWPDTFCPLLPASYELFFDVLDEYLDVMKPRTVHVGKDEWRIPWGTCPRCRNRDYRDLFVADVNKTYEHLNNRGVKMAMWGDHLIEPLRGAGLNPRVSPTGYKYGRPGAIKPEQAKTLPKGILMFNWFWDDALEGQGEVNDVRLEDWGFQQVYGNMTTSIPNYRARSARKSVIGGAPSSWAATTEFNFGKDLLNAFLGCANMLWSTSWQEGADYNRTLQVRVEETQRLLSGTTAPSELDPVVPLKLQAATATDAPPGNEMKTGTVKSGKLVFEARVPAIAGVDGDKPAKWPREGITVPIGEDVSSVVFLHALTRPAQNFQSYHYIFNFDDSADLLGWYEVVYEDGYIETVPIRYRVNILEWDRMRRNGSRSYSYRASAVDLSVDPSKPVTFYAFEWTNPRLGKVVKEVRLKGTSGFKQGAKVIPANGVMLAGVSVVKRRPVDADRAR